MAKFCTKCGNELKNGKCSKCDKKSVSVEKKEVSNGIDYKEYANTYLDVLKGMFTKPVDTIKKYKKEDNFLFAIIALVINCLVTGLFVYFVAKEAVDSIFGFLSLGFDDFGKVDVPFFKVFINGFIFMASWFASAILMIYLVGNKIMKDKITLKESTVLVGTISVFTAVTTLASIILLYISAKLMVYVLLIAATFYLTYLYQGLSDSTEIDKNKLAYLFVSTVAVAIYVMVYLMPKILF